MMFVRPVFYSDVVLWHSWGILRPSHEEALHRHQPALVCDYCMVNLGEHLLSSGQMLPIQDYWNYLVRPCYGSEDHLQ